MVSTGCCQRAKTDRYLNKVSSGIFFYIIKRTRIGTLIKYLAESSAYKLNHALTTLCGSDGYICSYTS
jgi:hypothetical protein